MSAVQGDRAPLIATAIATLLLTVASPIVAQDTEPSQNIDETEPSAETDTVVESEPTAEQQQAQEAARQTQLFGRPTQMDYSAKPFALAAGAALLNRFDFVRRDRAQCPVTDPLRGPTCILLTDSTPAPAFVLELSYRNRWAWLDRTSGRPVAPWDVARSEQWLQSAEARAAGLETSVEVAKRTDPECDETVCVGLLARLAEAKLELHAAAREYDESRKRQKAYEDHDKKITAARDALTAATRDPSVEIAVEIYEENVARAERQREAAKDSWRRSRTKRGSTRAAVEEARRTYAAAVEAHRTAERAMTDEVGAVLVRQRALDALLQDAPPEYREMRQYRTAQRTWHERRTGMVASTPDNWNANWYEALLPEDLEVRLGYAFVQSPSGQLTSDLGGSNVYAALGAGWNLLRWTHVSSEPDRVPIRGTFNLEATLSFSSDKAANDVHDRYFLGGSTSIGIPLVYGPPGQSGSQTTNVVEMVARVGLVIDEVPDLYGLTPFDNEVRQDTTFVSYGSQKGFGLEVEFNVPVARPLGYVFFRGGMVAGIDPNPWFVGIGYTIPIGTLTNGLRVQSDPARGAPES